ncbi:MAG: DUF6544 family protein [Ruminiclostridium sp.]
MLIISSVLLILIIAVIIFFNIPYSKTNSEFSKAINAMISNAPKSTGVFTKDDINDLPSPVQKYFEYCGYLGTPKMSYSKAIFKNVDFKMSEKKTIKIDYTQYNFVTKPERFAFIDSSLYGIPFEGFDSYRNGVGGMKGTIAKVITLFDQKGKSMDKACLVTILAECLAIPNIALQDYIKWEEIDAVHAKGTITYYGISASGIFTFDENGLMLSFKTKERLATNMDGSTKAAEWSAIISDYQTINCIRQPKVLQSIWHYSENDSIYFNENKSSVLFEYK